MKKNIIILAAVFGLIVVGAKAQSIKTEDGRRFEKIEKEIKEAEDKISAGEKMLADLRKEYSDEQPEIKQVQQQLDGFKRVLAALIERRNALAKRTLARPLPSNNIELLKIIILQNERIIELLENQWQNQPSKN